MTLPSERLIDCDEALRAYDELWSQSRRVLCVQGMSGIGKSRLLLHLFERHETARPRALLDLAALPLTREDILCELTDQLAADPKPARGARHFTLKVIAKRDSVINHSPAVVALGDEPEFAVLDRLNHLRHREWVLLVDHCDELDAEPQLRRWFEGRLLAKLLAGFSGLRVVLAAEHGPRGPAHERRSHPMRTWTAAETGDFLTAYGLLEKEVTEAVHEAFDGLALFVELAGQAWELSAQTGSRFDLVAVDRREARGWLFDRLLGPLPTSLCEAVKAACLLRRFNLETLSAAGSLPELSDADFEALTRRTWVRRHEEGGFEVDRRVRRVCVVWWLDERPEGFSAFHARARRIFEGRGAPVDVLYHILSGDPEAGLERWARSFDVATDDERAALGRLLLLPEIRERLGHAGWAAWRARAESLFGAGSGGPGTSLASLTPREWTEFASERHEQTQSYARTPAELDMRRPGGAG